MSPHPHLFVTFSQLLAYFWGRCQDPRKGQGPALLSPGKCHDNRHHDPSQTWAAHRPFSAGESTITVMPSFADLGSPTPFQRFVDHHIDPASCLDKALSDE